jgi:hypothetical protein
MAAVRRRKGRAGTPGRGGGDSDTKTAPCCGHARAWSLGRLLLLALVLGREGKGRAEQGSWSLLLCFLDGRGRTEAGRVERDVRNAGGWALKAAA